MFRFLLTALMLALAMHTPGYAARASVPMQTPGETAFNRPDTEGRTLDQVKDDIIIRAASLRWLPLEIGDNSVTLRYQRRRIYSVVKIDFTTTHFTIRHVASSPTLRYEVAEDGTELIHPSYNNWMRNLANVLSTRSQPLQEAETEADTEETAPEADKGLPENVIALHYHRNKRDFKGWGLHVWGDAIESPTSWYNAEFPKKYDKFGATYLIKTNKPQPGETKPEAFYILHKGDHKDQCGNDMAWDLAKGNAIYVVADDCSVYYSLEDAMKSKEYR